MSFVNNIDQEDLARDAVRESEWKEAMNVPHVGNWDWSTGIRGMPRGTTLPATCAVGDEFMDTDATSGQRAFLCETTNNWVLQGDGTGGGSPLAIQYDGVEQAADTQVLDIDTNDFTLVESPANDFDFQLNANVVQTNQLNVFGDFDQSLRSTRLRIANPANTFFYNVIGSAIGANRGLTFPLLTTGDTFTFNNFAASLLNTPCTDQIFDGTSVDVAGCATRTALRLYRVSGRGSHY